MARQTRLRERAVSRRETLVALSAVSIGGLGSVLLGSDTARAEVSLGTFDLAAPDRALDRTPRALRLVVDGRYEINAATTPDRVDISLQVTVGDAGDVLGELDHEGQSSGTFTFDPRLSEHEALSTADLMPATAGETTETTLTVRVLVRAIADGELLVQEYVQDSGTLRLTHDGAAIDLGGTGSIEIETATPTDA